MKGFTAILLSILYVGSTIGMPVYTHYCGGEISSVDLKATSCCCGPVDMGCCDEELVYVQLDADHHIVSESNTDLAIQIFFHIVDFEIPTRPEDQYYSIIQSDPPLPDKVPLWLTNCQPVFYG